MGGGHDIGPHHKGKIVATTHRIERHIVKWAISLVREIRPANKKYT